MRNIDYSKELQEFGYISAATPVQSSSSIMEAMQDLYHSVDISTLKLPAEKIEVSNLSTRTSDGDILSDLAFNIGQVGFFIAHNISAIGQTARAQLANPSIVTKDNIVSFEALTDQTAALGQDGLADKDKIIIQKSVHKEWVKTYTKMLGSSLTVLKDDTKENYLVRFVPGTDKCSFDAFSLHLNGIKVSELYALDNVLVLHLNNLLYNNLKATEAAAAATLNKLSTLMGVDVSTITARKITKIQLDYNFSTLFDIPNLGETKFDFIKYVVDSNKAVKFNSNWSINLSIVSTLSGLTTSIAKLAALEVITLPVISLSYNVARYVTQTQPDQEIKPCTFFSWAINWFKDWNKGSIKNNCIVVNSLMDNFNFSKGKSALGVKGRTTREDADTGLFVSLEGQYCYAPKSEDIDESTIEAYEETFSNFVEHCAASSQMVDLSPKAYLDFLNNDPILKDLLKLKADLQSFVSVPLISNWDMNICASINAADPTALLEVDITGGAKPTAISMGNIINSGLQDGMRNLLSKIEKNVKDVNFLADKEVAIGALISKLAVKHYIGTIYAYLKVNSSANKLHIRNINEYLEESLNELHKGQLVQGDFEYGVYSAIANGKPFISDDCSKVGDLSNAKTAVAVAEILYNGSKFGLKYKELSDPNNADKLDFVKEYNKFVCLYECWAMLPSIGDSIYLNDWCKANKLNIENSQYFISSDIDEVKVRHLSQLNNYVVGRAFSKLCLEMLTLIRSAKNIVFSYDKSAPKPIFNNIPALPAFGIICKGVMPFLSTFGFILNNTAKIIKDYKEEKDKFTVTAEESENLDFLKVPGIRPDFVAHKHQGRAMQLLKKEARVVFLDISPGGGKCLVGSSLVPTGNGILSLQELWNSSNAEVLEGFKDLVVPIVSTEGVTNTSKVYSTEGNIYKVTFSDGSTIKGLAPHKMLSLVGNNLEFVTLKNIRAGDYLPKSIGANIFSEIIPTFNCRSNSPKLLSIELSSILGFVATTDISSYYNTDSKLLELYAKLYQEAFDLEPKRNDFCISNLEILPFLNEILVSNEIPLCIRMAPKKFQVYFLRALFETIGIIDITDNNAIVSYATSSKTLAAQLKAVLENMGIYVTLTKNSAYIITVIPQSIVLFSKTIGCISANNAKDLNTCADRVVDLSLEHDYYLKGFYNQLPCNLNSSKLAKKVYAIALYSCAAESEISDAFNLCKGFDKTTNVVTRDLVLQLVSFIKNSSDTLFKAIASDAACSKLLTLIHTVLDSVWVSVVKTENTAKIKPVFDLSVPGPHNYSVNGLMGHNTIIGLLDILTLLEKGKIKRPLVFAPKSLIKNWMLDLNVTLTHNKYNFVPLVTDTLSKWGEEKLGQFIRSSPPNTIFFTDFNFLKVSSRKISLMFMNMQKDIFANLEWLKLFEFDYILIDESHKLKNANSKGGGSIQSKLVAELTLNPDVHYIRLLTGTIVSNEINDIIGQARLVDPSIFRTIREFKELYSDPVTGAWSPRSSAEVKLKLMASCGVVSATKKVWAYALPTLVEEDANNWIVDMSADFKDLYELMYNNVMDQINEDADLQKKFSKHKDDVVDVIDSSLDDILDDETAQGESELSSSTISMYIDKIEEFLIAPENSPLNGMRTEYVENGVKKQRILDFTSANTPKMPKLIELLDDHFKDLAYDLEDAPDDSTEVDELGQYHGIETFEHADHKALKKVKKFKSFADQPTDKDGNPIVTNKVIIFVRHIASVYGIINRLPARYRDITIDYSAGISENLLVFAKNDDIRIIVGVEMSMNTGENLQFASRIIRMELCWAPGDIDQALSRVYRPDFYNKYGRSNVHSDWIVVNDTLDISKLQRLITKTIDKVKFDEYGSSNSKYDELPSLDKGTMSLKAFKNGGVRLKEDIQIHLNAYNKLADILAEEQDVSKQKNEEDMLNGISPFVHFQEEFNSKYADLSQEELDELRLDSELEGSVNLAFTPVVPLQNYINDLRGDSLESFSDWLSTNPHYVNDTELFIKQPVYVVSEFGYGRICTKPIKSKNSNTISSETIAVKFAYSTLPIKVPANSLYVATFSKLKYDLLEPEQQIQLAKDRVLTPEQEVLIHRKINSRKAYYIGVNGLTNKFGVMPTNVEKYVGFDPRVSRKLVAYENDRYTEYLAKEEDIIQNTKVVPQRIAKAPILPIVPVVKAPIGNVPVVKAPIVPVVKAPIVPVVKAPIVPVVKAPIVPVVKAPIVPVVKAPVATNTFVPTVTEIDGEEDYALEASVSVINGTIFLLFNANDKDSAILTKHYKYEKFEEFAELRIRSKEEFSLAYNYLFTGAVPKYILHAEANKFNIIYKKFSINKGKLLAGQYEAVDKKFLKLEHLPMVKNNLALNYLTCNNKLYFVFNLNTNKSAHTLLGKEISGVVGKFVKTDRFIGKQFLTKESASDHLVRLYNLSYKLKDGESEENRKKVVEIVNYSQILDELNSMTKA